MENPFRLQFFKEQTDLFQSDDISFQSSFSCFSTEDNRFPVKRFWVIQFKTNTSVSNLVFWSRLANKLGPWHNVYIIQQ